MIDKAEKLMELAESKFCTLSKFGTLSESEKKLFKCSANGEKADYNDGSENNKAGIKEQDILDQAEQWGNDRVLRADRIVWLCTDEEALKHLTNKGLQVAWAKIEGELDLRFATPDIPITFSHCLFKEPIFLEQAKVKFLNLSGSYLASGLDAGCAEIEGNVLLKDGFQAQGEVSLYGATIGGNLECNKGKFEKPKGKALNAENAEIKGYIFLRNEFKAKGEVCLYGATIGRNLECDKGTFENSKVQ